MTSSKIILNPLWLKGVAECELYQGGLHIIHLIGLTVEVESEKEDHFLTLNIKVQLSEISNVFPVTINKDATIETLCAAVSHETDNINRWIERNV